MAGAVPVTTVPAASMTFVFKFFTVDVVLRFTSLTPEAPVKPATPVAEIPAAITSVCSLSVASASASKFEASLLS